MISPVYIPNVNEVPDDIAYIYQPKDMDNPTHEDIAKLIESVQRSNAWFSENISRNIEENEIILDDLNKLSNDLQARYEKFKRENKVTFRIGIGINLVVGSVAAMVISVKTQAVVAAVFFKPYTQSIRDSITVTNVFIWVSGVLVGVLAYEMAKRARIFA
jgi:hypothetical protein